jgi:hypothetical protein
MKSEQPIAPKTKLIGWISDWNAQHPARVIVLVSFLAVIINCYPIIFCGRSYVAPPDLTPMVYGWYPTLPGMTNSIPSGQAHGSDAWATVLWSVPAGFIESHSLWDYGEIPLWNRFSHAGDPFIGQAVSMLGDPLQLIVILGRGSAEAWDMKFLTAKFIFSVGFGLLILRIFKNRPLSLVYAALAAYCGAFFFINNHPAFFVFSYAPWILLSALTWLDLRSKWPIRWGLVWLLVNVGCFNGGHVELAVDLIGGLNLIALSYALTMSRAFADLAKVLGRMVAATLLFIGVTAPIWISFLVALNGSYSVHSEVNVVQLPAMTFPGMFDDLFFMLAKDDTAAALAPGTSFLVLAGCILSVLRWRQIKGEHFFWINCGANLLWGGFVFGWIPASVIGLIPFVNRVGHIYTDFSYLLVVHLTIQSAYGFRCLAEEKIFRRAVMDLFWVGFAFVGLILIFNFGIIHHPIPWNYFVCVSAGALGAPLLFAFLRTRHRPVAVLGWTGILILGFIPQFRFGLYSSGNTKMLMIPGSRAILNAHSPAIDKIKADTSIPFRVAGISFNLFCDYSAVYSLEDLVQKFPGIGFEKGFVIDIADPVAAHSLLNLLNVKYLLVSPKVNLQEDLGFRIAERSDFGVLENLEVWPRAFFVDKIIPISSDEQFIDHLMKNEKTPFIALTDEDISKPSLKSLEAVRSATVLPATNYELLPNSTEFDIHANSPGIVCLTEGQAKDFVATANGEAKEILTVNRAFKGIYLDEAGNYHVKFTYRPRYWRLACVLFWIAIGVVIVLMLNVIGAVFKKKSCEKAETEMKVSYG